MIDITKIEDKILIKVMDNRQKSVDQIWADVKKDFDRNFQIWKNNPKWLDEVPETRSKTRDNRIFLATESVINKLTARPSKPNVVPANPSEEANQIAEDMQVYLLEKYRELNVKEALRKGLRHLFFAKIIVLKMFWDREIDDFNVKALNPKKVRFGKSATKEIESEFSVEEIDDKTAIGLISEFPDKEEEIMKELGTTKEQLIIDNPGVKYHEMWIGNGVAWIFRGVVLKKEKNPYWDWEGIKVTPAEMKRIQSDKVNGRRRRTLITKIKALQEQRLSEKEGEGSSYDTYLFNHFDRPRKPYIFTSTLQVEDKPTGDTSLIEQVAPLQEGIDRRKRQIDDNAAIVNGITKIDTSITNMNRADARRTHFDPGGLVYGHGVSRGVTREFGTALPAFVFNDMEHSIRELDEIYGTGATFRGSDAGGPETATGRAILREESASRLDEVISVVDFVMYEIYNWQLQMIKVNYTESHMVKVLGDQRANRLIDLMQDDIQEGVEIKVIPGQVLPEDRLFKAERAAEDYRAGLLDPVTYFEIAGGYENPQEVAKKLIMFQKNPYSIVEFDKEDLEKMARANEILAMVEGQPQQQPGQGAPEGQEGSDDEAEAQQEVEMRSRIQQLAQDPGFQALPNEEKLAKIQQIRQSLAGAQRS